MDFTFFVSDLISTKGIAEAWAARRKEEKSLSHLFLCTVIQLFSCLRSALQLAKPATPSPFLTKLHWLDTHFDQNALSLYWGTQHIQVLPEHTQPK